MTICKNCGSSATRESESGKKICSICLFVVEEDVQYTQEYTAINFKNQKKVKLSMIDNANLEV
jgi:transcription initiation factor TFIIIB Brf1 subunit/transcription initiation factor TFIIB